MKFLSRPSELLSNHQQLVLDKFKELNNGKIEELVEKLTNESTILNDYKNTIIDMIHESVYLHDEGKKNPYFQSYIGNRDFISYKLRSLNDKDHSMSSCIYFCSKIIDKYILKIQAKRRHIKTIQTHLSYIMLGLAYSISKHHSGLGDCKDTFTFINDMIEYYNNNKDKFKYIDVKIENIEYLKELVFTGIELNEYVFYTLNKLVYSLLVAADFIAVYEINNSKHKVKRIDTNLRDKLINDFNNNKIVQNINSCVYNNECNKYRSEMFIEAEENLLKNLDKNIFFLEAPTGSGKSITSLNLILKLINNANDKVFYVSPLNNISEQTYNTTKDIFKVDNKDIVLSNAREGIILDEEELNYNKDLLDAQMLNYPINFISHVKLFDMLFGDKRVKNLMFQGIVNSVIIIDEVQNYKNKIWIELINVLNNYAELLNIKIVIMSATLPKLDNLIIGKNNSCSLIDNRDYYYKYFKNRVKYDYSLLEKEKDVQVVYTAVDKIINKSNKHRILIQTLTTKSCEEMYNYFKKYESKGFLVYKMLGVTNKLTRQNIINKIQEKDNNTYKNKKIILIGTQCVEAGIDIDMQIGFKDISILDADEQFVGRINRNFGDRGVCYFYNLDDGNFIYKGDYRTERNLKHKEWQKIFENKKYDIFYNRNFKWLKSENKKNNKYIKFKNKLLNMQYKDIAEELKLIDTENYNFLFICKLKVGNKVVDPGELYKEYIDLNKSIMPYAEKEIKKKHIINKLSMFTYAINTYKFKEELKIEKENNFYIIRNGENFFDNKEDNLLTECSNLNIEQFVSELQLFM